MADNIQIKEKKGKYRVIDIFNTRNNSSKVLTLEEAYQYAAMLEAKYESAGDPKLTAPEKRRKRLEAQPEGYPGTYQAIEDSSKMYKDLGPEFKPKHIKDLEIKKRVQDEVEKLRGEIEKLTAEVDAYDNLGVNEKKLYLLSPEKIAAVEAKRTQMEVKKNNLERIKKKYPEYSKDPLGLFK